jgi:hypothetical protein
MPLLASDLIKYLSEAGFSVYPDEGFIPSDIPDDRLPALFVFGTGGFAPHDYIPRERPTFQVIVKGKSYKANPANKIGAEREAKRLIDLLHRKHNYAIGDSYVWSSRAQQPNPIPLGHDEHDKPMYSTNFIFQVRGV